MTFLAPGFLLAAGLVSLGVVVLHLLVTQQPRSESLPTVRFVPDVPARSTSIAIRPSDLLLLLLRVLTIVLIGGAFAQPRLTPRHQAVARIVAVDVSRGVGRSMAELADSARRYATGAAAVVLFDSTAREIAPVTIGDSLAALASRPRSAHRGMLSPALIIALRAAARERESADSLALVVVSPFVTEMRDAATTTIRSLWPGRVQVVRVRAADSAAHPPAVQHLRVEWADSGATTFWTARLRHDTVGAVRAGAAVLVYPFVRRWRAAVQSDSATRVYARWVDGEPAAFERATSDGCVRSLAVPMPSIGDAVLRPEFVRFVEGLSAPCGTTRDVTPLPTEFLSEFQGTGRLAPAAAVEPRVTWMMPLAPWLLAAALGLALVELLARRRAPRSPADRERWSAHDAEAASAATSGRAA